MRKKEFAVIISQKMIIIFVMLSKSFKKIEENCNSICFYTNVIILSKDAKILYDI